MRARYGVAVICYKFEVWFTFCCSRRCAVCNIVINWTVYWYNGIRWNMLYQWNIKKIIQLVISTYHYNSWFPMIYKPTRKTYTTATLLGNIFTNNYCALPQFVEKECPLSLKSARSPGTSYLHFLGFADIYLSEHKDQIASKSNLAGCPMATPPHKMCLVTLWTPCCGDKDHKIWCTEVPVPHECTLDGICRTMR